MGNSGALAIGQLRISLAQINPTLGDLTGNSDLILEYAAKASAAGAHVLLFPEMVITGYPVEDLALRQTFRVASKAAVIEVADRLENQGFGEILAVIGYLDGSAEQKPQNAVALVYRGEIVATYIKHHLPNYGVFDEFRNFVAGDRSLVVRFHGVDIGIAICEDIWVDDGPVAELKARTPG